MAQEVRASLSPKTVLKGQLLYRLNFASLLKMPESDFAKMIAEIEKDPFVQKLMYPKDPQWKVLAKKRFPNSRLSSSFYEMDERVQGSPQSVDVETLLSRRQGLVNLIQRIGRENFERHFLYRNETESLESSAKVCGITVPEAEEIHSLLLDLSIQSEFFHPSTLPPEGGLHYTLIARIEQEEGRIRVAYLSPNLASGRYMVNHEKIDALKKVLAPAERKKLKTVLDRINWINLRQDTLQKILSLVILRQDSYLRSGEPGARVPVTQKAVANLLKLAPSTVSRAIYGKSIRLPWGEEKPLKGMFLNKKEAAEEWIKGILSNMPETERKHLIDTRLKELLFQKYKLKASRRAVNLYRRAVQGKK